LSTRPTTARNGPAAESATSASGVRAGNGGSHTRCALRRCPDMAATVAARTVGRDVPDGGGDAASAPAPPANPASPAGTPSPTMRPERAAVNTATPARAAAPAPADAASVCGTGPDTYAAWNRRGAPESVLRYPAPGCAGR